MRLGEGEGEIFLGRDMGHKRDYSEQMAEVIDGEVRTFLETAHQEAYEILSENRDVLDRLVVELLDRETLDAGAWDRVTARAVEFVDAARKSRRS